MYIILEIYFPAHESNPRKVIPLGEGESQAFCRLLIPPPPPPPPPPFFYSPPTKKKKKTFFFFCCFFFFFFFFKFFFHPLSQNQKRSSPWGGGGPRPFSGPSSPPPPPNSNLLPAQLNKVLNAFFFGAWVLYFFLLLYFGLGCEMLNGWGIPVKMYYENMLYAQINNWWMDGLCVVEKHK